jgi:hypothetical protein
MFGQNRYFFLDVVFQCLRGGRIVGGNVRHNFQLIGTGLWPSFNRMH